MLLDTERMRRRLAALTELESHLSFRVARLSKLLDTHASRQLVDREVNLTGYRVLMVLGVLGETTSADLSRVMVIDPAQISRTVSDLLAAGLLHDRVDPASRRRKLLRLSEEGRAELDGVRHRFEARQRVMAELLSEEELDGLTAAIDKLSRHFARELEHPEAMPVSSDK